MRSFLLVFAVLIFPSLVLAVQGTEIKKSKKDDCGCSVVDDLRAPEIT